MNKKSCVIVIGHSKLSPGASNENSEITEYEFNNDLAYMILHGLSQSQGVDTTIVHRTTYYKLPSDINDMRPDFVISLHCNAYNKKASGTETLYYHRSSKSKLLASIVQSKLVEVLNLRNRGTKAKTSEDRGGYLLKYTAMPCVIAEPFFIDNNEDLEIANNNIIDLAEAYSRAILEYTSLIQEG